jgi:hypothetical protein
MNFLGLKSDACRNKLDRQLRRVGYRLGELDETFDDEIAVGPFARGDSFLLQISIMLKLDMQQCPFRLWQ